MYVTLFWKLPNMFWKVRVEIDTIRILLTSKKKSGKSYFRNKQTFSSILLLICLKLLMSNFELNMRAHQDWMVASHRKNIDGIASNLSHMPPRPWEKKICSFDSLWQFCGRMLGNFIFCLNLLLCFKGIYKNIYKAIINLSWICLYLNQNLKEKSYY